MIIAVRNLACMIVFNIINELVILAQYICNLDQRSEIRFIVLRINFKYRYFDNCTKKSRLVIGSLEYEFRKL